MAFPELKNRPKRKSAALPKEQVEQFNNITKEWKRETEIFSNLSKIVMQLRFPFVDDRVSNDGQRRG